MARIHYSGTRNASWALRAWLTLKEAGVDFDEEVVTSDGRNVLNPGDRV